MTLIAPELGQRFVGLGQRLASEGKVEDLASKKAEVCSPSNAGVEGFVDFQGLSSGPTTPASLDNAGVGTNPGTEPGLCWVHPLHVMCARRCRLTGFPARLFGRLLRSGPVLACG